MNLPFRPAPEHQNLPQGVSRPTWVVLTLSGDYPALSPATPLGALMHRAETLQALEAKLLRLARADWLHGVLLRFGDYSAGLSSSRAVGRLIARLSESKRTVAHLHTLTMPALLAASGASQIAAPESAQLGVLGLGLEVNYLGELLKKQGVGFENLRIGEYKSGLSPLSQDGMDAPEREQLQALLGSLEESWVRELAQARSLDAAQVRGWLERPLTSAQGALEAGMIDRVAYGDELVGPATRPLEAVLGWLLPERRARGKAGRVAVIPLVGTIMTGKSRHSPLPLPLFGGDSAGSDSVVAALRRARLDPSTKAAVLYVDSGGGSALASDLIWREVSLFGKPLVAVMGRVAASGGYYVLTHARHVVASPYTVTGSIGVYSGKPVLEDFNRRYGLNPERVTASGDGLLHSASRPYSEGQRAYVQRSIEEIYHRFVGRVAEGRTLSPARVNELGRGRIWSGAAALELGLVDELGDLKNGLARARELAGLPDDAPAWTATPARSGLLPEFAQEAAGLSPVPAGLRAMLSEPTLLWLGGDLKVT